MKKLIVSALALSGLSLSASAALFDISMRVSENSTGDSTIFTGTVDVNDVANVTVGAGGDTHTFSLNSLSLTNGEVSESWDTAELADYSIKFVVNAPNPSVSANFQVLLPLPFDVFGLSGRHEINEGYEWGGTSPFGMIDVGDIAVATDFDNTPAPMGGSGTFGPAPVVASSPLGHTSTTFTSAPVASVPEASSVIFTSLAGLAFCLRRKRAN